MSSPTSRPAPLWLPLLVVAAAWLAQGGALQADWILDDAAVVRDNPYVDGGLTAAFRPGAWHAPSDPDAWRPLALATLMLEAPLWEDDWGRLSPFGFHLTNVFLHGLVGLLLLVFGSRLVPGRWLLFAGVALLFVVHPVHVPTLATVVGRADVLALLLSLLTGLAWLKAMRKGAGWIPLVGLGYLLALLSKETALGLPLALLAVEALHPERALPGRRGLVFSCLLLVAGLYLWMSPAVPPAFAAGIQGGLEGLSRAALATFLPLSIVRDRLEVMADPAVLGIGVWVGACLAVVALILVARLVRGGRWGPARAGFVSFVAMGLLGALVAPLGSPLEARFGYVILAGLFVVLALLLMAVLGPLARGRAGLAGAGAAGLLVLLCLGALSWVEAGAWRDEVEWHRELIRRQPSRSELGLRLIQNLRVEAGRARQELAGLPADSEQQKAARARFRMLVREAHQWALGRVESMPGDPAGWRELGLIQLLQARAPEATQSLRRAADLGLDVGAGSAELALGLAESLLAQGRPEEVGRYAGYAAGKRPNDVDTLREAGLLLVRAHDHHDGLVVLRRAIDLARSPAEAAELRRLFEGARRAARDLADASMQRGHRAEEQRAYRDATVAYEEALRADPSRLEAYLRLAWIRGEYYGDYRSAHQLLDVAEKALEEMGGVDAQARGRLERQRRALREQQAKDEAEERDG